MNELMSYECRAIQSFLAMLFVTILAAIVLDLEKQ